MQRVMLGGIVLMFWGLIVLLGILLVGCHKDETLPPVPPPPEDLSSWSVPELVQPPAVMAVIAPPEAKPTPAEKVYPYAPGTTFAVQVSTTTPLDLVFEHGEEIRNIAGGDRAPAESQQAARLEVKEGADGLGETLRQHVFITAGAEKVTTGLIITTTKRTYHLSCTSVKTTPIRTVRWTYPHEEPVEMRARPAHEPGLLPDPFKTTHYHVGYVIEPHGHSPDWQVRGVWDDGKKMFLLLPITSSFSLAPMARAIGPNGPMLINLRQFKNALIVDNLWGRLELRVGIGEHAEVVTITRGALKTIECPGAEECPVWPPGSEHALAASAVSAKGVQP
jgi:type IV secretion system protein VirB9